MKKIGLTLALALICGTNVFAQGHCYWPCWGFLPSFSLSIGIPFIGGVSLGLGCPSGYYHYYNGYPAYSYVYSQPRHAYAPPPANDPPPDPQAYKMEKAPSPADWVPSTPGTGQWVPEPNPYSYTPAPVVVSRPVVAPPVAAAPSTARTWTPPVQKVTVTRSPEGIPLYIVSQ